MSTDKHVLYWHLNDYRMANNLVYSSLGDDVASFSAVAFIPPAKQRVNRYRLLDIGEHRYKALVSSLQLLSSKYQQKGSKLQISDLDEFQVLSNILNHSAINCVMRTRQCGFDERQVWQKLKLTFPDVEFVEVDNHTLLRPSNIEPMNDSWPMSFSKFKKKMPDVTDLDFVLKPEPATLPPALNLSLDDNFIKLPDIDLVVDNASDEARIDELLATQHLEQYFSSSFPQSYKQTRNALMGASNFTGLSAFLSLGLISVHQVVNAIKRYDIQYGSNEGTDWICFELLWRDYFFWLSMFYQKQLFLFGDIQQNKPLLSFYPEKFVAWCTGTTPWPLVNACMKQLNTTGHMSNRGRQIVASCLVNELSIDWRYGAAYFQQQLVDYDVASNWGNWQYIAGVGTDPRGGRHFNVEKQTQLFDSDGSFRRYWLGDDFEKVYQKEQNDYNGWPMFDEQTSVGIGE
ncbi:MAG: DASH family cryptochrome [Gammaproteobacteria bacterium]|nr:DASH family cryptochrome [Gammaproteobacteria bacterium]